MSAGVESELDTVVMYLHPGESKERFTKAVTYRQANDRARELEAQGNTVIALITPEHAGERQSAAKPMEKEGLSMTGVHLHQFLGETVRNFRKLYPGVSRESALEVTSLLCTALLKGDQNLQEALLDEIHSVQDFLREPSWHTDMRLAIANRRPEGE